MKNEQPNWNQDLSDWIMDRLETRGNRELSQAVVAKIIEHGDRPYYSVKQVRIELKSKFDSDTVRARLNELTEQGVLRRDEVNGGGIFYLKSEKSKWPIPTDTTVEPMNQEMTVSEFFDQKHVSIILGGILGLSLGAVMILLGVFYGEDLVYIPLFGDSFLPSGLTLVLLSTFVVVLGLVIWVYQKTVDETDDLDDLFSSD